MKHIKHLQIDEAKRSLPHALSLLRNAAAVTLMFSKDHDDRLKAWRNAEHAAFGEREEELIAYLDDNFFDELYVERDEIRELSGLMALRQLIIIRGDRGSGKSTAMRLLERKFPNSQNDRLIFVDLNEHRMDPELRPEDSIASEGAGPKETVCDIIYREIFHSVLGEDASQDHADLWSLFLLRNAASYFNFFTNLLGLERPKPSGDEALLTAMMAKLNAEGHRAAAETFAAQQGTARLYFLLCFCLEKLSIRFTVFLDNIDQIKREIQQDVVDRCMDLSAVMTPIVAVRNANYYRIAISNRGAETYIVKAFAPKEQIKRRAKMQEQINEPEETALQASDHILTRFIRRRLKVAIDTYRHWAISDNSLAGLAEELGFSGTMKDFLNEHMQVLDRIAHELSHSRTVSACLKWHNGSLRTSGSQIFNIINAFVTNKDPLFRYPLVLSAPDLNPPSPRELRTMTYRHLVFMGRTPKTEEPRVINIFEEATPVPERARALQFFSLKVLEYLAGRVHKQTTWGRMSADFARALISPIDLFNEVKRLSEPRGSIPDGYIYLDIDPVKIEDPLPDDLSIELLPSGQFFLDELSVSVEYLFWMALYENVEASMFKGIPIPFSPHHLTDEFRAEVAIDFLEGFILPRFSAEVEAWHRCPDKRSVDYWRLFGRGSRGFFPERAAGGIQGFLNQSSIRTLQRSDLFDRTEAIRATCEGVWDEFAPSE